MAGHGSQLPGSSSTRPASAVNPALDFINGHGSLPEVPAPNAAPTVATAKKGKSKKAADPSETGKLLAAKINQLELDAAGEKDQEAEIGSYPSLDFSVPDILAYMAENSFAPNAIDLAPKVFDTGGKASMARGGFPDPKIMQIFLAEFVATFPEFNIAAVAKSPVCFAQHEILFDIG